VRFQDQQQSSFSIEREPAVVVFKSIMKNFSKDILIVDFEVTGFNIDVDEPIQIGVIVLDKNTLEEKTSYASWIKPSQEISPQLAGLKWANISGDDIKKIKEAKSLYSVAIETIKILPEEYIFCAWNASFDFYFWRKLLQSVNKDIHTAKILDLWTLAYINLHHDDEYKGDYKSESVFQYFGAAPRLKHDGLEDCRIEAMVFKKLIARY